MFSFSDKPEEEVFAESYDDQEDHAKTPKLNLITNAEALEKIKFMGYPCCPNKWNVYHECSLYWYVIICVLMPTKLATNNFS